MATLQGIPSKVIDTITRKLGLQTAIEPSVFELAKTIQPIIEADEKIIDVLEIGSGTFTPGSANREFYLCGFSLTGHSNGSNNGTISLQLTMPNGASRTIVAQTTDTAGDSANITMDFSNPLKIENGSDIVTAQSLTSGAKIMFYGYTRDV